MQRFAFDLPIQSLFQEMILLITPIASVILIVGFALLISRKRKVWTIIIFSLLSSILLFSDLVYYRFFNDFITLPVLFQTSNMGDLQSSIWGLIKPTDILIFLDTILLVFIVWWKKVSSISIRRSQLVSAFAVAICFLLVNWSLAEMSRPQLLARTFDRQIVVKNIGAYNYHLYDLVLNTRMTSKKVFADNEDLMEATKYIETQENTNEIPSDLYGIAEGKNVILISMESLQSFVINETLYDQEITPFLNDLIGESYYFDNFYHQTGQGKTSDSEFIVDNALYPLPSGAVFFTHAQNTYYGTPNVLKDEGYYSAVFHANEGAFWNRDVMYDALGYDFFYDKEYYEVNEENSVGWGLKDEPFFQQTLDKLEDLPEPFYTRLITLTNHYPFEMEEEDLMIPFFDSGDATVDQYFSTVRYMDEALKQFFEDIKQTDLYEDTIFILYGDHYGISANHNEAMSLFLDKDITPYEHVQLQRVPLIIHIPGMEGKTISQIGGQIDLRSTVFNLLGVDNKEALTFGSDLFLPNKENKMVILRDRSFITEDVVYTAGNCYDRGTGEMILSDTCELLVEQAEQQLDYSDEIIYGDLMRFIEEDADKVEDELGEEDAE